MKKYLSMLLFVLIVQSTFISCSSGCKRYFEDINEKKTNHDFKYIEKSARLLNRKKLKRLDEIEEFIVSAQFIIMSESTYLKYCKIVGKNEKCRDEWETKKAILDQTLVRRIRFDKDILDEKTDSPDCEVIFAEKFDPLFVFCRR